MDDDLRTEEIEIYYDPGELFGGLLRGPASDRIGSHVPGTSCPFSKGA